MTISCPKDYEEFFRKVVQCEEYQKALNNSNHLCHAIIHTTKNKHGLYYLCEPFRLQDFPKVVEAEVMFLGLSPGNPEKSSPPTPGINDSLEDKMKYCGKRLKKGYDTNFKNAMKERIGCELRYVKANVVHGIGDKNSALNCLETCGNKFLKYMIELFRKHSLKYVIVYDFDDKKVLDFVSKKYNTDLDFKNSTKTEGIQVNGITFIAARRTRKYIARLHKA